MKKYYLHSGTEQQGPFDIADLKAMHISKETSIWFEGLPDWTTAEKVDELKEIFYPTSPPPFQSRPVAPPPFQTTPSQISANQPNTRKRNNDLLIIVIIVLLLVIVGGVFFIANKRSSDNVSVPVETDTTTYQEKVLTVKEIESSKPKKFLTVEGTFDKNFWGNKLKVHGIIKNAATVSAYKDVMVRIIFYSNTKTELGREDRKLSEIFPPQSETKFELKIEGYKGVDSLGWSVREAIPN